MHVLTKAFVVLAAVLSVALSALVIAYAVNTDRIQADYRAKGATVDSVNAQLATQASQANSEQARLNAQIEQLMRDTATQTGEITRLQGERATLTTEKNKAESARQSIESKIAELGETVRTQASIIQNYRDEVTTLRGAELAYRNRALEMDDRLSDLESQREVLEQNYRALQEQIAEAKRSQELALSGGGAANLNQPFVYSGSPINGRIEDIKRDPASGKMLARISVGSNDRVAKNMKFFVVRGENFLGNLVVTEPDLKFSVGEISLVRQGAEEIKEGDLITSRLQ